MTGPFMVEIVFCRVTRRGRKKRAGLNKAARENCTKKRCLDDSDWLIRPDTVKPSAAQKNDFTSYKRKLKLFS